MRSVLLLVALTACDSKVEKLDKTIDNLGDKVKDNSVVKSVDKGLDTLDRDEASTHLAKAREMVGKGEDPAEACSWVTRAGTNTDTDTVKQLDKLCKLDVPLGAATKAVVAAEKAKAEQPQAPSQTKTKLEGSPFASDARWADLKSRWTKVCP